MQEVIKRLSNRILALKEKNNRINAREDIAIETSVEWNISRLFLELIYKAGLPPLFEKSDLEELHSEYEKENKIAINLDQLIDKQWIRIINNEVKIPSTIQSAVFRLRDLKEKKAASFIKDNLKELMFIKEIHGIIGYSDQKKLLLDKKQAKKIIETHQLVFPACPGFDFFRVYVSQIPTARLCTSVCTQLRSHTRA